MRLLLLVFGLSAAAAGFSQKVTLSFTNASLPKVLDAISKQTGMSVVFKDNLLKDAHPVTIDVKDVPVEEALKAYEKSGDAAQNQILARDFPRRSWGFRPAAAPQNPGDDQRRDQFVDWGWVYALGCWHQAIRKAHPPRQAGRDAVISVA